MSDLYKLRHTGTHIDQMSLPQSAVDVLLEHGFMTVERVYGAYLGSPEIIGPWLVDLGVNVPAFVQKAEELIPQSTRDKWAALSKEEYATGLLIEDEQ